MSSLWCGHKLNALRLIWSNMLHTSFRSCRELWSARREVPRSGGIGGSGGAVQPGWGDRPSWVRARLAAMAVLSRAGVAAARRSRLTARLLRRALQRAAGNKNNICPRRLRRPPLP